MSRSHFERIREVVGTDDLLVGTVTVAYLDAAAQNHSLVEGASDPYPDPHEGESWGSPTRADGRARTSPPDNPPGGCPTDTESWGESRDGATTPGVIREEPMSYANGGERRG